MIEKFFDKQELIFSINKPINWTSFDIVKKVRCLLSNIYQIKKLKVGHAGTLDPLAKGVLVICVGKATKKIDSIQATDKEYIAEIKFGETTPSFDSETEVDLTYEYRHITKYMIESILPSFIGIIKQQPPIYSAIKINGRRAYDFARSGENVELAFKSIEIKSLEIIDFNLPILTLKITCGKGTYIRSLARDLGEALNSGAYLTSLVRTRVGKYKINDSSTIDNFEKECKIVMFNLNN